MVDSVDNPGRTCAREDGLVGQPHGGALGPPFAVGNISLGGFRRPRREARALLREGSPDAARRLLALTQSDDERVAVVAVVELLNRTLGKATELPQTDGATGGVVDLGRLTADERDELVAALATVGRLRDLAARDEARGVSRSRQPSG